MLIKICFILFLIIANTTNLTSQTQPSLYEQMIQAFHQLDYDTAKKIGNQVTTDFKIYTPTELLETHKILGVIAYLDGNLSEANSQFEQALSIDWKTQLDSIYVSPKIIEFFKKIKLDYDSGQKTNGIEKSIHYRYLVQPDPRPTAVLRSMLVPGWGQLYKNDRKKGYVLVSSAATITLAMVIFHFVQKEAYDEYRNATDLNIIEQKYDNYNRLYKCRNNAALIAGGIWLYSFFDALLTEPKPKQKQLKVTFNITEYPYLSAQFLF